MTIRVPDHYALSGVRMSTTPVAAVLARLANRVGGSFQTLLRRTHLEAAPLMTGLAVFSLLHFLVYRLVPELKKRCRSVPTE